MLCPSKGLGEEIDELTGRRGLGVAEAWATALLGVEMMVDEDASCATLSHSLYEGWVTEASYLVMI